MKSNEPGTRKAVLWVAGEAHKAIAYSDLTIALDTQQRGHVPLREINERASNFIRVKAKRVGTRRLPHGSCSSFSVFHFTLVILGQPRLLFEIAYYLPIAFRRNFLQITSNAHSIVKPTEDYLRRHEGRV